MMRTTALALLPVLTLALGAQPQADHTPSPAFARAMKVIPVADLVAPLATPAVLPLGTLIDMTQGDDGHPAVLARDTEHMAYRVNELADLVRRMTPLNWDDGNASVDQVGDSLILTGAPDQIHLIEQSLQRIAAVLGDAGRVRAAVFAADHAEPGSAGAESYTDACARLRKQCGAPLWEGSASAFPNQIVSMGIQQVTPYVADCDVEIAQSQAMANPVVLAMHEGARVQVELHALANSSDLVLFCHFALGEKLALRPVSLGPDRSLPTLQTPEMATTLGSTSGRIGNGGALVVQLAGALEGRALVLVVGAERTPVSGDLQREAGLWPVSAFLSPALRQRVIPREGETAIDRYSSPAVALREDPLPAVGPGDGDLWNQLLMRALGDGEIDVSVLENGYVAVRGSPAVRQTAARLIDAYQEQFLRTLDIELRTAVADSQDALRTVRLPALMGRSHYLVHGIETTTVIDAEVEVAQKAGISDPMVRRQFSGIVAQVQAYPGRSNDLGARAWVEVVQTSVPTSFATGTEKGVTLQQATVSRATFRHEGLLPVNTPIDLGETGELSVGRARLRPRQSLAVRMR